MATTWWWAAYRHDSHTRLTWRNKRRIAMHSLLAGIAVYFALVLTAALYMAVTSA